MKQYWRKDYYKCSERKYSNKRILFLKYNDECDELFEIIHNQYPYVLIVYVDSKESFTNATRTGSLKLKLQNKFPFIREIKIFPTLVEAQQTDSGYRTVNDRGPLNHRSFTTILDKIEGKENIENFLHMENILEEE